MLRSLAPHPVLPPLTPPADGGSEPLPLSFTASLAPSLFGSRYGLTPEQAQVAMQLWWRAWQRRGPVTGLRRAGRLSAILRVVREGVLGNAAWGRRMLATRASRAAARKRLEAQGWRSDEADRLIRNQQAERRAKRKAAGKAATSVSRCPTCGQRVDGV